MHRIVAQLRICGQSITDADMIDKTFSTFSLVCDILSQQYWNTKFTKHANLMRYMMIAEKQQQLLLKTDETWLAKEIHNMEASNDTKINSTLQSRGTNHESHVSNASKRTSWGNWRHNTFNKYSGMTTDPLNLTYNSSLNHRNLRRSKVIVVSAVDMIIEHKIVTLPSTYVTCSRNLSTWKGCDASTVSYCRCVVSYINGVRSWKLYESASCYCQQGQYCSPSLCIHHFDIQRPCLL